MDQTIRFLAASDGVRIAYAESGSGPPLVKAANWLSHLEFDWQSPVWRHWFSFLSSRHRLVRYDERGCGLSDWTCDDLSLDRQVADLESVVATVGLERFPLLGISQGGAIAVEYAVRHPESVTHLVLYGSYAQGPYVRGEERARRHRAMMELVRTGWGDDNPAFRQLFACIFIPEAKPEQVRWFGELMARTTNPHMAARILEAFATVDLTARLPHVRCPTIVLHARDDYVPFEQGRMLAAGIPGARFSALEGRNHILLDDEPAWPRFRAAVHDFLGESIVGSASAGALDDLTVREREILCLVARGHSNLLIGSKLNISEKTVRNHLTSVFDKLQVGSRAQAIVFARDHGVVSDVR
ncbi:MAG TPA: alpha/beta fold hydrolase [Gammaproteobacteria bacterium]|nr:alpha/beta fold hydrolase [Gammaproteobacteria bacterium]